MSMQSHIVELEKRHEALERQLAETIAHPSSGDEEIAELKRRKLVLKDQLSKLKAQPRSVH